jgi:hypothetical protein
MMYEEQFRRNLTHAFELFEIFLNDPAELDKLADNVSIVAMPADDPELCAANESLVRMIRARSASPHGAGARRGVLSGSTLLVNV